MSLETHRASQKRYYYRNRKKIAEKAAQWKKRHRKEYRLYSVLGHQLKRLTAIMFYSDGDMSCACCGEATYEFLCIDHIAGGGNQHQRREGYYRLADWLVTNNLPNGFRVLCHNCNMVRGTHGYCPHTRRK